MQITKRYPAHHIAVSLKDKRVYLRADVLVTEQDEDGEKIQRKETHRTALDATHPHFLHILKESIGKDKAERVVALLKA